MNKTKGVIEKFNSKQINTKRGQATVYSIGIAGVWYSLGFKSYDLAEGMNVELTYDDSNRYKNVSAVEILSSSEEDTFFDSAPAPQAPAPATAADDRQASIIRQNALSHATKLVVEGGYIDRHDNLQSSALKSAEFIIKVAREFEYYAMTGNCRK